MRQGDPWRWPTWPKVDVGNISCWGDMIDMYLYIYIDMIFINSMVPISDIFSEKQYRPVIWPMDVYGL